MEFIDIDREFNREVQNMLRIIGRSTGEDELVIPENGILDTTTGNALRRFQSLYDIPVTGVADETTFNKLAEIYERELFRRGNTAPIRPYPVTENYELSLGERSELVFILQLMLNALSIHYNFAHIPVNGTFDTLTEAAVRDFQKVNMLPVTGIVDRYTWKRLAEDYNETVNDSQ